MNKRLRIELLKESLKQKLVPVLVLVGVAVFGYLNMPSLNSSEAQTVFGQVQSLRGAEGDGVKLYLDVKLDSGKNVLVSIPSSGAFYKKGKRLRLQKRKSNILGANEYHFIGYVSENKI